MKLNLDFVYVCARVRACVLLGKHISPVVLLDQQNGDNACCHDSLADWQFKGLMYLPIPLYIWTYIICIWHIVATVILWSVILG